MEATWDSSATRNNGQHLSGSLAWEVCLQGATEVCARRPRGTGITQGATESRQATADTRNPKRIAASSLLLAAQIAMVSPPVGEGDTPACPASGRPRLSSWNLRYLYSLGESDDESGLSLPAADTGSLEPPEARLSSWNLDYLYRTRSPTILEADRAQLHGWSAGASSTGSESPASRRSIHSAEATHASPASRRSLPSPRGPQDCLSLEALVFEPRPHAGCGEEGELRRAGAVAALKERLKRHSPSLSPAPRCGALASASMASRLETEPFSLAGVPSAEPLISLQGGGRRAKRISVV